MATPTRSTGRHADFDVEQAVHGMPSAFIQCRDFNHSWRPYTAQLNSKERCYEVTLRCSRCKTLRKRQLGLHGELLGSSYEYTDGYLISGMGRLTGEDRNVLRLESIRRVLPEDTMDE